jgi:signal transduction histidine kinase
MYKTSQLSLKRNRNKFSKLFESSNDLILILDNELKVLDSNESAKKTFGNKLKSNAPFTQFFDAESQKKITAKIVAEGAFAGDITIKIPDLNNRTVFYAASLVKWQRKRQNQYGLTLKDLSTKLLHDSEEQLINEIYRISSTKDDQFSFLEAVLSTICKTYFFDFGQVWVRNKDNTFFLSNDLNSEKISFEEYKDDTNNINTRKDPFSNPTYQVESMEEYKPSNFIGVSATKLQELKTMVVIPIPHLEHVTVSFLFFSKKKSVNSASISGLFKLLALVGEINYKKKLTQELSNKNIILSEAEKISGSGSWSVNISDFLFNDLSDGFKFIYQIEEEKNTSLFTKVIEADLNKLKTKITDATKNNVSFFIEYRIKVKSRLKYIHMRGIPKYDLNNLIIGYHGSIADVTMLKEKNVELELLNGELEALNENLEQFTYIASHDLQEPLRKIQTFGNLLKDSYEAEAPGYEYIIRMQKASKRMQKLISDLLDYSRVSRVEGNTEVVNFNELVKEVLENFDLNTENEKVIINLDILPSAYPAYKTQLFQLFQNLLSNAIKFRQDNKRHTINISHKIIKKEFDQLTAHQYHEITIEDNGIGFDTQYADKIFDMFQRLHGKNEYPGTGIGLAICKKIVENHHGIIKVNSTLGIGSVFKIYLPVI